MIITYKFLEEALLFENINLKPLSVLVNIFTLSDQPSYTKHFYHIKTVFSFLLKKIVNVNLILKSWCMFLFSSLSCYSTAFMFPKWIVNQV